MLFGEEKLGPHLDADIQGPSYPNKTEFLGKEKP